MVTWVQSDIEDEDDEDEFVQHKGSKLSSGDTRKIVAQNLKAIELEDSQDDIEEDKRRGEDIEVDFTGIRARSDGLAISQVWLSSPTSLLTSRITTN